MSNRTYGTTPAVPGGAVALSALFVAALVTAQVLVNVGFLMNLLVLALVYSTILAPAADPEFAATFEAALAPTANVIAGSLLAYVVKAPDEVRRGTFGPVEVSADGETWTELEGTVETVTVGPSL